MGQKEDLLLESTLIAIKDCHPEIEDFLLSILSATNKSNAYVIFKRRIYRLIREMASLPALKKYQKAETAIQALKEVNFLLPDSVQENLNKFKNIEQRDAQIRMADHEKAIKQSRTIATKFDQ